MKGQFMRPAPIMLFIIILVTTSVLACNSDQNSVPSEKTPELTELPDLRNTSTPATSQPVGTSETTSTTIPDSSTTTPYSSPPPDITETTKDINATDFKVVGYVTHWHLNKLSNIKLKGLTHLIWQGIEITDSSNPDLRVANNAGWWQISDVVSAGHADGIKVLASLIGPWNESSLNNLWKSSDQRKKLVENLLDMVRSYDLDGIDIDNENKGWDMSLYSTFVRELHEALSPLDKIISVAGSPYRVSLTSDVFPLVDFINLMTYDMGAPDHSTLDDSMQAVELWANQGMPREKLLIGIPFYGRDGDTTGYEYWWIVEKYNPDPDQNEVSESKAAGGIIWWNGVDLAKEKVLYARLNNLGGIMMYELAQDSAGNSSLLQSVYDALEQPIEITATDISRYVNRGP